MEIEKQPAPQPRTRQTPEPQRPSKPLTERIRERRKDIDLINSIFDEQRHRDWEFDKGFRSGQKPKSAKELIPAATLAFVIDSLFLVMVSGLFMIGFAVMVGAPVRHLFDPIFDIKSPLIFFLEIFAGCYWLYAVTLRLIAGATFGERYCNLKLGTPSQRWSASYGLRVALRETLIISTGILSIPLYCLMRESDPVGNFLKLEFYEGKS